MAKLRFHQVSMFEDYEAAEREPYLLRQTLRYGNGHFGGFRIRVFAALTYDHFQQYASLFLRRELENGGGTIPGSVHAFVTCTARALTVQDREGIAPTERKYAYPVCVDVIRQMIEDDEWLTRTEEIEVGRIVNEYGGLPYPRARLRYPECAWGVDTEQGAIVKALAKGGD